jgi:Protein of unknown function (DUF2510)
LTDNTPAGSAPKRTPAAKTPAAKATTAKAAAPKTTAPKASAAKTPVAKTPVAKTTAAKTPAAKATAVKTTAASTAPTAAAASIAPAAATAPAGWYPVAAGSSQQRWWDGSQWTEHVYGAPATQTGIVERPAREAAGVKPGTVWFWLLAVGAPVLTILDLIPTSIYLGQVIGGDTTDPTAIAANTFSAGYLLVFLSGWFIYAVCIVFALLDWRELKAHGVPRPFHWAWSFFVLLIGWPVVYMIGRSVVVKRRTGAGLAPLWVFIGLEVVAGIVTLVVVIAAIAQFISVFSDLASNAGNVF